MSTETRLLLRASSVTKRFEHEERGDYDLDKFEAEFRERLYSPKVREIEEAWERRITEARTAKIGVVEEAS